MIHRKAVNNKKLLNKQHKKGIIVNPAGVRKSYSYHT